MPRSSLFSWILIVTWLSGPLFGEMNPPPKPRPDGSADPYHLALPGDSRVFQGEVVVWMEDDDQVLVAVDVARGNQRDGLVDHVFSFRSAGPMPRLDRIRSASAWVEDRGGQLSVFLPSEHLILYFVLREARAVAFSLEQEDLSVRTFRQGVEIARYSDEASRRVPLEDVARGASDSLSPAAAALIGPYFPPPTPAPDGSSCLSSCGISASSCPGGSCSASCSTGFCAKCECIIGGYPSCRCGR